MMTIEQVSICSIEKNEFSKLIEFDDEYLQKSMLDTGVHQDQIAPSLTLNELEEVACFEFDEIKKIIEQSYVGIKLIKTDAGIKK